MACIKRAMYVLLPPEAGFIQQRQLDQETIHVYGAWRVILVAVCGIMSMGGELRAEKVL